MIKPNRNRNGAGFQKNSGTGFQKNSGTGFQPVSANLQKTKRNLPHWQLGGSTYFLTFNTKGFEFSPEDRKIVFDACFYWQGKKWNLHQIVVMNDHVHVIATPLLIGPDYIPDSPVENRPPVENRWHSLGEIVHSIKRFSAHEINQRHGRRGPVWWDEYYDRLLRNQEEFEQKWQYIRYNPIKGGLTARLEDYEFYWDERQGKDNKNTSSTG